VQLVYDLSYPHQCLKNWCVVYKVHPEMNSHRHTEYMERHEDDDVDVYQEEIEGHQGFTVSNEAGHADICTCDIDLMEEEESSPVKKCLRMSQWMIERK
jgi:hypothetical protein